MQDLHLKGLRVDFEISVVGQCLRMFGYKAVKPQHRNIFATGCAPVKFALVYALGALNELNTSLW